MRFLLALLWFGLAAVALQATGAVAGSATAKYCSPTADNVVVYIDRTTNYDDTDKRDLLAGISSVYQSLKGGERLSIRTIADSFTTSASLIDECVPVCADKGFFGDLLSSDCTEGVAISDKNRLRDQVVQQVRSLLDAYSDLPYSEIVRTISMSSTAEIRPAQPNKLFLFTDLIENSQYLPGKEFWNTGNDKLLPKLTTDGLIPDLKGAQVRVFGVGRSGKPGRPALEQDLMKKLTEFWTAYFMAAGASLVIQQSLSGQ